MANPPWKKNPFLDVWQEDKEGWTIAGPDEPMDKILEFDDTIAKLDVNPCVFCASDDDVDDEEIVCQEEIVYINPCLSNIVPNKIP